MDGIILKTGDLIRVEGALGIKHSGIYLGPRGPQGRDVIHNNKGGGVLWDYLENFSAGKTAYCIARADKGYEEYVAERALRLLGQQYNLFTFNCEHFTSLVYEGKAQSQQLQAGLGLALIAGLLGWGLVAGANRPTYDLSVGRYRDRHGRFA